MMPPSLSRIQFQALLPQFVAGGLMGLLLTVDAIAVGLILFSGLSTEQLPFGIGLALFSTLCTALLVTLTSSLPVAMAGPSFETAAILGPIAGSIHMTLTQMQLPELVLPTVWALISLTSLLTGILLLTLGRFRLSRFLRFVPYPVLGGFLAGTGWLVVQGGIGIVVAEFEEIENLEQIPQLLQATLWSGDNGFILALSVVFTGVLMLVSRRYSHFAVIPSLLLTTIAVSHMVLWVLKIPLTKAIAAGWFLEPFHNTGQTGGMLLANLNQVDWLILIQHSGNLIGVFLLVPCVLIFDTTGLEITLKQDIDIDHELKSNGLINCMVGLGGGTVCHLELVNTLRLTKSGATTRLAGAIAVGLGTSLLILSGQFLSYIPTFVVVALTISVGADLLIEWLYNSCFKLSRLDYGLIVLIFLTVIGAGFLQGIGFGILAACLLFVINYSRLNVIRHASSGVTQQSNVQRAGHLQKILYDKGEQVYILHLQGYIFFGTADTLLTHIRQRIDDKNQLALKFLVIDFRWVDGLDSSALLSLIKLTQLTQKHLFHLVYTALRPAIQTQLQHGECLPDDDPLCHVFVDLDRGLEWCESQILETITLRRRRFMPLVLQLKSFFPNEEIAGQLMPYLERQQVPEGSWLFRQGDRPNCLYFIEVGQVTLVMELDGKNQRLQTIRSGAMVGERALYAKTPYTSSAIVDQSSTLYRLSNEALHQMELEAPLLAATFHKFVLTLLTEQLNQREQELRGLLQ